MTAPIAGFYDPAITFDKNFDEGPFPFRPSLPKDKTHGEPRFSFLGYKLYSPFGIAAGPLPTSKHTKYAFDLGFDVVCYKTQRSMTFPVNQFPNVLYLDVDGDLTLEKAKQPLVGRTTTKQPKDQLTITNSFGNPSRGPKFWVQDMKQAVQSQKKGQLLIASVVGTIKEGASQQDYYEDFAHTAELAVSAGAPAVEVNLSCPNVASEGVICYTPEAVVSIGRLVKAKIGNTPLIAKLGYFSKEQQPLLESILLDSAEYYSAIAAINTISAPIVDEKGNQALPGPNRLNSGVCGAAVKWAGLDMTKRLKAIREKHGLDYQIIGIGGVMNAKDFQAYRKAGADVVQSCTGAMWNPLLAQEIKATL